MNLEHLKKVIDIYDDLNFIVTIRRWRTTAYFVAMFDPRQNTSLKIDFKGLVFHLVDKFIIILPSINWFLSLFVLNFGISINYLAVYHSMYTFIKQIWPIKDFSSEFRCHYKNCWCLVITSDLSNIVFSLQTRNNILY